MNAEIWLNFYNSFPFLYELKNIRYEDIKLHDPELKKALFWLIIASRGGETRAKILNMLISNPLNKNELSKRLNLNYRTITHHLNILKQNGLISEDDRYGGLVYLRDGIMEDLQNFLKIYGGD